MPEVQKIDLLDVVILFAKNKFKYTLIVFLITLFGLVIALIWPKQYISHLTYVTNQGNGLNMSSGGILGSLASLSVSTPELSAEQILIILRSDDLLDLVITEFDLEEVYKSEIPEVLRLKLNNAIKIEDYREGGFGISSIIATKLSFEDEDPVRAYEMLKYYYSQADSIVLEKNKASLKSSFDLLSGRFETNKRELFEAEDSLNAFQKKFGIIEIEEQAKAAIINIANIQTQIVALELQVNIATASFGEESNQVRELSIQLSETRKKYNELVYSESDYLESDIQKPLLELPDLTKEYIRLFREAQVQQELYKVLYPQYEQQKLNFEEIQTGLMLIDDPDIPTYKSSPKRAYIVIASFLFANLFATIVILFRAWKIDVAKNDEETQEKLDELRNHLKLF